MAKGRSSVVDPDPQGSRTFAGSGSDFWKGPDPDPDLNKFSEKFLLEMFLAEICSKKFIHDPKS
jgi:hypothetical protein